MVEVIALALDIQRSNITTRKERVMAQGKRPSIPFPGPGGYEEPQFQIPEDAQRPVAVIESPYSGDIEKNVAFAQGVCRYYTLNGYSPYASHLLLPQWLKEDNHNERMLGIHCGFAIGARAATIIVFALPPWAEDLSRGMSQAFDFYKAIQKPLFVAHFNESGTEILRSEWR